MRVTSAVLSLLAPLAFSGAGAVVLGGPSAHANSILGGGGGTDSVVVNHNIDDGANQQPVVHSNENQMQQQQEQTPVPTPEAVPAGVVGEQELMNEIHHEEEVIAENSDQQQGNNGQQHNGLENGDAGHVHNPIENAEHHPETETTAEEKEEKAEEVAREAEVAALSQDEVARAAEAMLNGGPSTPAALSAAEAQKRLAHANEMCTLEMRHVANRNMHHPLEALAARSVPRESDISVSLGTDISSAKLAVEVHSALVAAGCRVVDRWCADARCVFRTCFCRPVRAETGKPGLIAKEQFITKEDAKLEADMGALEEKSEELADDGKGKEAEIVKEEAHKVEEAVQKNEKEKVKIEEEEQKMDENASKEEPHGACQEGFIEVPTPSQPICKRVAFPPGAGGLAMSEEYVARGLVAPPVLK